MSEPLQFNTYPLRALITFLIVGVSAIKISAKTVTLIAMVKLSEVIGNY